MAAPIVERILVTNDDGIHAHGLTVLESLARKLAREVIVVAPELEQSGAGHSLTLRRPLRLREFDKNRYVVDGTPTDCVMLGVQHLLKDTPPDLILSGVNAGCNLGDHITYSGTVSAAMEGTLLGVPSIALSLHLDGYDEEAAWNHPIEHGPKLIARLVEEGWPEDVLMNINFPRKSVGDIRGTRIVPQGKRKFSEPYNERIDPYGRPYYWLGVYSGLSSRGEGTDLDMLDKGYITVTPLRLTLTHHETLDRLKGIIDA